MSLLLTSVVVLCLKTLVMMPNMKYIITGIATLTILIGYNMFLIQRDNKLFEAYYGETHHEVR